jgi:hypothetical protein
MKIIFVDIDGVLNSRSSFIALGPSRDSDDFNLTRLNPVSTGLLQWIIVNDMSVHLYFISTWTWNHPVIYFIRLLQHYGINNPRVLDFAETPRNYGSRTDRIQNAIDKYAPESYVILDDIDLTKDFGNNMIHINPDIGFSYPDLIKVCNQFDIPVPLVLF